MNILVLGSGGRENAILWKLRQSPSVQKLFVSPGNGGCSTLAKTSPLYKNFSDLVNIVRQNKIDLTVVGPEIPLAAGIADFFQKENLPIFGVDRACAKLESSKIFSKRFMQKHGMPTADFESFDDAIAAADFCRRQFKSGNSEYSVIKADGLAAGKGVILCDNLDAALDAIDQIMVRKSFGAAGEKIIIEKRLQGEELSLLAFCDGKTVRSLPSARDYKRVFDGQKGPNTGGMGAISPLPVSSELQLQIENKVIAPFLKGLKTDGLDYRGVIYFGLMLTAAGPYVLEFNIRFGDPETQSVLPLLRADLAEIFVSTVHQKLSEVQIPKVEEVSVGIVCASGGYPGKYENHKQIFGLAANADDPLRLDENGWAFHAGTVQEDGKFYTNGGRVLNVVALGKNFKEAHQRAYDAIQKVSFEGMHYRTDIGKEMFSAS